MSWRPLISTELGINEQSLPTTCVLAHRAAKNQARIAAAYVTPRMLEVEEVMADVGKEIYQHIIWK
jgi:hypothetical protein